jgi:hypothetical protein
LKNQVIVRGVVRYRRPQPEPSGHPEVEDQDALRVQAHQEVFGAALDTLDGTAHRLDLQRLGIHQVAQLRLPHPYPSNLLPNQPCV